MDGKPQRFQVGNARDTTEAEAQRRLDYIRDLFDRQCAELAIDFWANWTLPWAMRLASGPPLKVYATNQAKANVGQAAEDVSLIHRLQSWGVPIQVADPEFWASGNGVLKKEIEEEVSRAIEQTLRGIDDRWATNATAALRREAIPDNPLDAETRTLHEAIDVYSKHLHNTGKRDDKGNLVSRVRKCQDRLGYIKNHHEDIPLWKLNLPQIQNMAAYWRNRPLTKKGNRCSRDHAHDMNKEFFRFLSWLDSHPAYKWEEPKGTSKIRRSPEKLREDTRGVVFQTNTKETYSPKQLGIIAQHTDSFGRALLGVCVNCAFGASEVGQLSTNGYALRTTHPHAAIVGIKSTDADSWIVGPRPKTGVYGEHLLWREIADAVAPFLDGREVLPVTSRKTVWYRTHSSNPQSRFAKWWSALLDRVQKHHPDFPRLPFGSLRDLLPNVLRREFSDETASMCLQHGQIGEDDLLKCYANTPFKKLFDATRQLEPEFRPFLDSLTD